MRFIIASQMYWPIWLGLRECGYTWAGMILGIIVVTSLWSIMWYQAFGTWKFWAR